MKMSKKIIYVTLIVMMSFFTIFAQNNVMAAKKENKVYTISKKSKLIDVGSHLYSTYGSDYVNKYTRDWYLFRSYLEKLEVSGGGKLIVKGRMRKSKKKANCENGKKIASKTRKFKVSSKCQVIECEGLEEYAYGIKSYMRERGIKSTKNWANISNRIKVVNGKVTKIYLSA